MKHQMWYSETIVIQIDKTKEGLFHGLRINDNSKQRYGYRVEKVPAIYQLIVLPTSWWLYYLDVLGSHENCRTCFANSSLNLISKLCNSIFEIIKDVINFHYQ